MNAADFFIRNYKILRRPHEPMKWMERMFADTIRGKPCSLVELPTGAGKTELVVIWLLSLAWYGLNGAECQPVPRRLIWIVNRRVLVQQVFTLARVIQERLMGDATIGLRDVFAGLHALCGPNGPVFQVVELRGQIVADRDWAIRPTMPQLVIGTVDQIGSRLLFQGYGLGKWGRPQQAGLLGVDAWITVDEAHLVPAFVLTLRQLRKRCNSPVAKLPSPLNTVFARLPFWLTELSATPGLPRAFSEQPFNLTDEEKLDPAIDNRILAAGTRRVLIKWLPKSGKPKDVLVESLVSEALKSNTKRIAIFVREVGVADAVAKRIQANGVNEEHICKITGRIRGFERDRISQQAAFKAFLSERQESSAGINTERFFLIGTAAAEVGLDADADMILCDFASLSTLLQRLGRLDRRGILSRRHIDCKQEPPMMWIFASGEETIPGIKSQLSKLAAKFKNDTAPFSAEVMAGTHWLLAENEKEEKNAVQEDQEKKGKDQTKLLVDAATWNILDPQDDVCSSPSCWLAHQYARIAAGPVIVPPVTEPVLDYWSATTDARSPHLSLHPFLYGLAGDEEGTPLVSVAFRLEVEALRDSESNQGDIETPDVATNVLEIFKQFPPLRAEMHHVKLSVVREWLASPEMKAHPLVYRAHDQWHAKAANESGIAAAAELEPHGILVLPASQAMKEPCKKLLEDCEQMNGRDIAISDVLDGISDRQHARYLRSIDPIVGCFGNNGAWLWKSEDDKSNAASLETDFTDFKQRLKKELRINGKDRVFRYYCPSPPQSVLQYLDDRANNLGHITRAKYQAISIAEHIAPGNIFLRILLSYAAHYHDEGKRFSKWQRAFGRPRGEHDIAKLHPDLRKPAPLHGFRHEWESLRRLARKEAPPPTDVPVEARALWCDLLLHLVGVHHGHLRPSIADEGFTPNAEVGIQNPMRLEAAERFDRLQSQLGHWRLAYLEALMKSADAEGSSTVTEDEDDGN